MTYHTACSEAQNRSRQYETQFVTKVAGLPPKKAYRVVSEDRYNNAGLDDSVIAVYKDGQKIA